MSNFEIKRPIQNPARKIDRGKKLYFMRKGPFYDRFISGKCDLNDNETNC